MLCCRAGGGDCYGGSEEVKVDEVGGIHECKWVEEVKAEVVASGEDMDVD